MSVIKLLRPKHWIKNFFVFIPLLMSGYGENINEVQKVLILFLTFCMVSSIVYILNDIKDVKKDKNHPVKKFRPIACGDISSIQAVFIALFLAIIVLYVASFYLNISTQTILFLYLLMNIFYSFGLKNLPIIDVTIISIGFIFRVCSGAFVLDLPISFWLISVTFSISMMLAIGKRHYERIHFRNLETRKTTLISDGYSENFNQQAILFFSISTFIFYSLYVFNNFSENYIFLFTMIFVSFGLLRYLQLFSTNNLLEEPTQLVYKDMQILTSVCLWVLCTTFSLYWV